MLSKSQIKLINSLSQKKYRNKNRLFVAEGVKVIKELLNSSYELHMLFAEVDLFFAPKDKFTLVTPQELKKITKLSSSQSALALFEIPETEEKPLKNLVVALDGVRDPGNLGTIIRLCDWFGVKQLLCSKDTVDCYNEKVVQATMGSLTRVNIAYADLYETLKETDLPVFATFMDGESVYKTSFPSSGILVLGNEANGISSSIATLAQQKISIPQFGQNQSTESLNVATATAILLNEWRRG
ncbi:RNA methyltransferase [Mesonia sp. MT50]|uniref:RNA methyltransferase n=1 Tax=Mesonia profundi TaxID=3070998 RepID=A0ABU1A1K2_9FLAO|nr:RNA methyltransferase [Mesonia profundi]MDQ7917585.1 RNA methyltransferase [Mesonia profundi]